MRSTCVPTREDGNGNVVPVGPEEPIFAVPLPQMARKVFTLGAQDPSVTVSVTLCDNALANNWLIPLVESNIVFSSGPKWMLHLQSEVPPITRSVYQVPRFIEVAAVRNGLTISATVQRSLLTGSGYPPEWSYILFGFGLSPGASFNAGEGPSCEDTAMLALMSGSIAITGQTLPSLVCASS